MFNTHLRLSIAVIATFLSGCLSMPQAPIRTVKIKAEFVAEEAYAALEKGPNQIKGSALLRQQGGGVVTCAGMAVTLLPATLYAAERIRTIYGSTERGLRLATAAEIKFDPDEPLYRSATKSTRCDAQGFFRFDNLKDGNYFITTDVVWGVPQQYGTAQQGGSLIQQVSVRDGETIEIVLTSP